MGKSSSEWDMITRTLRWSVVLRLDWYLREQIWCKGEPSLTSLGNNNNNNNNDNNKHHKSNLRTAADVRVMSYTIFSFSVSRWRKGCSVPSLSHIHHHYFVTSFYSQIITNHHHHQLLHTWSTINLANCLLVLVLVVPYTGLVQVVVAADCGT